MSIIAYPLEATEYSAEDVQSYLSTRTSGVYSEEITATPEGMTVTISPFLAWLNYAEFKGCSVAVTEPETLTFEPAHTVLDRIDIVVLRLDRVANKAYLKVKQGLEETNPRPATVSRSEAAYDISPFYVRIRAGATEIKPEDITSTILDESVCGIMRDGVTGIPTAQLQERAEAIINGLSDGSAFLNKSVYDPEGKAKPVAFADEVDNYPVGTIICRSGNILSGLTSDLPGTWNLCYRVVSIPLRQFFIISEANKIYKEVIDVSGYGIKRDSYNIVALPKSSAPSDVSISFGEVTFEDLGGDIEYVNTIEICVSRKTAVNTWVHILLSGEGVLGADHNMVSGSGKKVYWFERVE